MAKKQKANSPTISRDLAAKVRYPIGLLFQVSTLAGCIAYLLFSFGGQVDFVTALYRSMIVFIGFTVSIGILMVATISVLHKVAIQEAEEKIRVMHEEQLAQQQLVDSQIQHERQLREERLSHMGGFSDLSSS